MGSDIASLATAEDRAIGAHVAKGSAGSSSMSPSTITLASPSPRSCPTRGSAVPPPSSRPLWPTTKALRQGPTGDDRQRLLLQIFCLPHALHAAGPQTHSDQALYAQD